MQLNPELKAARGYGSSWLSLTVASAGLLTALLVGALIARDTALGVAAAVGVCYAPIVLINLPLGVALWTPLAFFERVPLAGPGPTLILILVGVAWLGALPSTQRHVVAVLRRHAAVFALMFASLAWLAASVIWAADGAAYVDDFWIWLVSGAVFTVVATSISTERIALILCVAFVFGALASEFVAILQGSASAAELDTQEAGRLGAGGQDPNFLAAGLVPAAAIGIGLLPIFRRGPMRLFLIGSVAAIFIGIVATGSRGGLVATAVAVVTAIVVARGRRLQLGVLVAIAVVIGSFWISTSSLERVKDFETGTGRVDLWRTASEMAADHPLLGVGLNNFRGESVKYSLRPTPVEGEVTVGETPLVAHSVYLQHLAELGTIGFLLFAGFIVAALRASWNAARTFATAGEPALAGLARAVLVGQVGTLTASLFISNGNDRRLWVLLALGVVLSVVAARRASETHPDEPSIGSWDPQSFGGRGDAAGPPVPRQA